MPFTISHIAAVLPLKKYTPLPFSSTALIIGSMVPDFEYFMRMTLYGHYGHTARGILTFDFPAGLLLYVLYHAIVRRPLITHLPSDLRKRFETSLEFDWRTYFVRNFLYILLSLFIGIATHFIWDGFTHDEEYIFAGYFPVLLKEINIGGRLIPLHFILQIISSFAGMAILAIYIYRLPGRTVITQKKGNAIIRFWSATVILAIFIGIFRWMLGMPNEKLVGQIIVVSMSAFMLSLVIICFFYRRSTL